jgi:hypothetical protein
MTRPSADDEHAPASPMQRFDDPPRPSNVPIPDPSVMTTRQLVREVSTLRELLEVKLARLEETTALNRQILETRIDDIEKARETSRAMLAERLDTRIASVDATANLTRDVLQTRLDGMDKAITLLQDTADKFPARIDEKIAALREVHEQRFSALIDTHLEKFSSIQTQFRERDVRTEQSSKDSKVAVDAALQAAKEAVGEQNKSSALAIAKSETSTTKQIDQLAASIQQMTKAFDDKVMDVKERLTRIEGVGAGASALWGYVAGAVGLLVGLAGLAFAILKALKA